LTIPIDDSWLFRLAALLSGAWRSDLRNLITDIAGLKVGHAQDEALGSGATAIVFDEPAVAACDLRGGGPGTRETELLAPAATVERIDALTLSGGSAFGLDAASGAQAFLREQGRGFAVGPVRVPIVPAAIVFDLLAGSGKGWGRFPPYRELGYRAAQAASADFALGSTGAGLGATVADLKGGIGSASDTTADGLRVGAIVVVNAVGCVTIGDGPHFWAAPFERGDEFGGRGWPARIEADALAPRLKGSAQAANRGATTATTIALVATDAVLTKAQAHRLAVMAQTGLARAIYPVHTPLDGDIVFAAATGRQPLPDPLVSLAALGALAANTLARAVARAVYEASALPFAGSLPSWRDRFG
jgi:L-aminopeptidase/D-esterase-like protein